MKYYVDLGMTREASPGDKVAAAVTEYSGVILKQPDPTYRPTLMQDDSGLFVSLDNDEWMEEEDK